MFRDFLRTTPMTTDVADSVFGEKIYGDPIKTDTTFVATLRALVAPRMKDDETLYFDYCGSDYGDRQFENSSLETKRDVLRHLEEREHVICLHEFAHYNDDFNKKWLNFADEDFCNANPGFTKLDKVTAFFRKSFGVSCFINVETRCVQLFTTKLDAARIHYLQCGIFAYLPWYFDPKEGVSELEMELISALREKTPDKYKDALTRIAAQYDFRTIKIKTQLKGFETAIEKSELEQVSNDMDRCNRDINAYNRNIATKLRELSGLQTRYLGLQQKISEGSDDSEIMDYFLCSRAVELIGVDGSQIEFGVKQYLDIFDETAARNAINNRRSYVYGHDGVLTKEQAVRLMKAIFIEDEVKLKVCGIYRFSVFGPVEPVVRYSFGPEFDGYTPNTHINQFGCMGSYLTTINELLRDHKYLESIEQCIASCKSLNFTDGVVMSRFVGDLYNNFSGSSCIEMPDGSSVTALEAAQKLMEGEKADG